MDIATIVFVLIFIVILAALVVLRTRFEHFEIKSTDILIAISPIVIYLLATGQIQKLEIVGLKIETAFKQATSVPIAAQVASVRELIEPVLLQQEPMVTKGPILLKDIIERKTEGLKFRTGREKYSPDAISYYLNELSQNPFFHYIVIETSDGLFFGLTQAQGFIALTSTSTTRNLPPTISLKQFVQSLEEFNELALKELPGFIFAKDAVNKGMSKMQVLKRMEGLNVDTLPVVDEVGRFIGAINRSRITASLLIDVGQTLQGD
jgi:hypothetical protein